MKFAGQVLALLAGWGLMAAMVAAPSLGGGVPPWAIATVLWILAGVIVCWLVSLVLRRERPVIPAVAAIGIFLLAQGWVMAWNAASHYDAAKHRFWPQGHWAWLPASVDGYSTYLAMLSVTALFGVFLVAAECWQRPAFRRQVLWTAALMGASVAVLGILQKAGAGVVLPDFWKPRNSSMFGPFGYHANAGALMLAALPAAGSLAALAFSAGRRGAGISASLMGAIILLGICCNTARAAVVLAVIMLPLLVLGCWRIIAGVLPGARRRWWLAAGGAAVLVVLTIGASAFFMPAKWRVLRDQMTLKNPRLIEWKIVLGMAGDAGPFGFGPNTFSLAFPITPHFDPELYNRYLLTYHTPGQEMSIWSHAHSDPLQGLVEWGWVGGGLWILAAIWTAVIGWRQLARPGWPVHVKLSLLAPFAGWLALMVYSTLDFPMQVLSLQLYAVVWAAGLWAGLRRNPK